jgi:hypothetical protein
MFVVFIYSVCCRISGSHSGGYAFMLVSCSAYWTLKMLAMFLRNVCWLSTDIIYNLWCIYRSQVSTPTHKHAFYFSFTVYRHSCSWKDENQYAEGRSSQARKHVPVATVGLLSSITEFAETQHWILSRIKWIQYTHSPLITLRTISITIPPDPNVSSRLT